MKSFFTGLLTMALLLGLSVPGYAQLTVEIGDVDVSNFPTITAQVTTRDGGAVVKPGDAGDFALTEDGFEQSPLTLDCPVGTNLLDLAFIVGNGRGHTQGDIDNAVGNIQTMVNHFNESTDKASVSRYSFFAPTCDFKYVLKTDIMDKATAIAAFDLDNYLYDIMVSCGQTLDASGAMVLFTNGANSGGNFTFQDVQAIVAAQGFKIFLFHMGGGSPNQALVDLVHSSGGFVSTELADPPNDIIRIMRGTPDYCLVSWDSNNSCRDGEDRELSIEVSHNQKNASANKTFALSADASTEDNVTFKVENATITSGISGKLTISVPETLTGQRLYSGSLQLNFDNSKLDIESASGENALAANSAFTVQENANGAEISFTGVSDISGGGDLFYVIFKGGAATQQETVAVSIDNVVLDRGCLNVGTQAGEVQLLPKSAALLISGNTLTFNWDDPAGKYDPESQAFTATIRNTGDIPVTGLTAILKLPPELKFTIISDENAFLDKTELAVDEVATAVWYIKPHPQNKEVTVQVEATANCTEGGTDTKKFYVNIKAATSGNRLSCDGDIVTVDNGAYTPDPATMNVTVWGVGAQGGPAGECKIVVPTGITFAGSAVRSYPALGNGLSSSFSWDLEYPADPNEQTYQIMFVTQGDGVNPDTCIFELIIPGLTLATFNTPCIDAPTNVNYDEQIPGYTPNPFTVSSTVENTGTAPSDTLWAELVLPAGLVFEGNDMMRKMVSANLAAGDTADIAWDVQLDLPDCEAHTYTLTYRVYHAATMIHECTKVVRVAKRTNEAPSVDSKDPDPIGNVTVGVPVRFQVTTSDPDGDPLTYVWKINDVVVSTDSTTSYTHTFQTVEQFNVTCTVTDFCGEFTFAIWSFTPVATDRTPEFVSGYAITGNYPNPFNPSTTIEYRIPDGQHHISMELLDTNGKLLRTLLDETTTGGTHRYELNAGNLPSGSYIIRLASGAVSVTRTIMLVK